MRTILNLQYSRENNMIPKLTKRGEDAGYDLYIDPVWFEENYEKGIFILRKLHLKMFPTGIRTSFDKSFVGILYEKGSTGTICMSRRAGVVDSGFRGIWQFPINNTSLKNIIFYNEKGEALAKEYEKKYNVIIRPISKAIGQVVFHEIPVVVPAETDIKTILSSDSERGEGMLGSTDKC